MNGKKIFQYGCGKMSVYTMRYVMENGGEIIGAVDVNEKVIGMDIGDITKTGKTGVLVSDAKDAEKLLNELKPDCVIVTTMSLLSDLEDALLTCAKCGCNAVTTCEEAFYPENSNPTKTKKIDKLAKENMIRSMNKLPPLNEDETNKILKQYKSTPIQRLENILNYSQAANYLQQSALFTSQNISKLFMAKAVQKGAAGTSN